MRWLTRHAKVLLAGYTVFLCLALLSPSSNLQSDSVALVGRVLDHLGVPYALVAQPRLEFIMNAVIIAPVPFLGSIIFAQYTWRDWTAFGFAGAFAVEAVQGVLLQGRNASFTDVVANTLGALIGAGLAELSRRSRRARVS